MRKVIFVVTASVAGLAVASPAGAGHAPAYPIPEAACNQGTLRALERANDNAVGKFPLTETGVGCHHHHP